MISGLLFDASTNGFPMGVGGMVRCPQQRCRAADGSIGYWRHMCDGWNDWKWQGPRNAKYCDDRRNILSHTSHVRVHVICIWYVDEQNSSNWGHHLRVDHGLAQVAYICTCRNTLSAGGSSWSFHFSTSYRKGESSDMY